MSGSKKTMNEDLASTFTIILPTHSNYVGVVKNYLQLLKKNWKECPFKIVVSITGEPAKIEGVDNLYNGNSASLIDCVVSVTNKFKSKYYISFLGDAFIGEKIDNSEIVKMLNTLVDNDIEYCSLKYVKKYTKEKKFNQCFRYINNLDRYSHNFLAFVASREYILKEMAKYETDLDFEKAYLNKNESYYFDNHLIVRKNYFRIVPGIVKGEWDRINFRKLKCHNPEIDFDLVGGKHTWRRSFLFHLRDHVVSYLPTSVRVKSKKRIEAITNTKFGTEG